MRGAWFERAGISAERPLRRLAEAVEVVQRLLRGDDSAFDGEIFPLAEGTRLLYPRQRDRIDVLLGTWGPRGLALAGRCADEVKLGGCANPDMTRHVRRLGDDACDAAARPRTSVGIVAGAVTVVDEDGAAARARARTEVAIYLDVVAHLDTTVTVPDAVLTPLRAALACGDTAGAGRLVPDELLDRFAFAGDPATVADHAAELFAAGASAESSQISSSWRCQYGGTMAGESPKVVLSQCTNASRSCHSASACSASSRFQLMGPGARRSAVGAVHRRGSRRSPGRQAPT
jgi:5,10-methylenetetrahydromethanopterin reductase